MVKHLTHTKEILEKQINELEVKKNKLQKAKIVIERQLWDESQKFKCPIGKNNQDAICPKCELILPTINDLNRDHKDNFYYLRYSFPCGMDEELKNQCEKNKKGCREWTKKNIDAICGCRGSASCMCGYNESFCFQSNMECPFCGRALKMEFSEFYKPDLNLVNE